VGDGECELSKKLKSITKSRKKKNLCISSAEARERIDYERSRCANYFAAKERHKKDF